jgi:hypothetical protein
MSRTRMPDFTAEVCLHRTPNRFSESLPVRFFSDREMGNRVKVAQRLEGGYVGDNALTRLCPPPCFWRPEKIWVNEPCPPGSPQLFCGRYEYTGRWECFCPPRL